MQKPLRKILGISYSGPRSHGYVPNSQFIILRLIPNVKLNIATGLERAL